MNIGNIGLGSLGLGGLSNEELRKRIGDYRMGIGSVPAPITAPKAVAPKPTPVPYRGGPPTPSFGPVAPKPAPVKAVAPKPAPVKAVAPKPAITDNRVSGAGVDYVAPTPTAEKINPFLSSDSDFAGLQNYRDNIVSGGADYKKINDVDNIDNYYDDAYEKAFGSIPGLVTTDIIGGEGGVGGGEVDYSNTRNLGDEEYRSYVGGVPEYLTGFKTVTNIKDTKSAYGSIAGVSGLGGTSAVLSDHYGYDIIPTEAETRKFGGNLQTHTSSNAAELSEFQSLVKPILKEQIPYLQATEGLGYQDALMEAYKRDPMLQSLYAKYDVTPARQTKDGSSYLYDPMSYAEIRTKEVKDSSVKDAIKMAAIIAASVYGGGFLAGSGMFGSAAAAGTAGGALGTAGAYGTASALVTAATGGDTNDILKSFALGGIGGYAKGLNAIAKGANVAAKGAKAGSTLANTATATAETAKTFNKIVKTGTFITKAVKGDVAGAAISMYGEDFTKGALNKVGLTTKDLESYNINQDDLSAGLVKTQLELAKGTDFGDALAKGLGEYIKEGGALSPSSPKTPEFLSKIAKVIRETGKKFDDTIFEPVKDAAKPIAKGIRKAGKGFDDRIIEPVKEASKAVTEPIVDVAKTVGSAVDDTVIQPVRKVAKAADDTVIQPVRKVAKAVDDTVIQPVRKVAKAADDVTKPVREGVSDVVKDAVKATGLGVKDIIALLTGGAGAGSRAGSSAIAGAGVRGSTPGIIEEKAPDLFTLGEREEENPYDIANYLSSLSSGPEDVGMVKIASGGMITNYTKQIPDSTLDDLLRIVGSRR